MSDFGRSPDTPEIHVSMAPSLSRGRGAAGNRRSITNDPSPARTTPNRGCMNFDAIPADDRRRQGRSELTLNSCLLAELLPMGEGARLYPSSMSLVFSLSSWPHVGPDQDKRKDRHGK